MDPNLIAKCRNCLKPIEEIDGLWRHPKRGYSAFCKEPQRAEPIEWEKQTTRKETDEGTSDIRG